MRDSKRCNCVFVCFVLLFSVFCLSGFAIAVSTVQQANMYMFDEPSSYLDVRQRIRAAHVIRSLCTDDKYVIAVEHDLSVLDYLSDFVCVLYGQPGAYGVVTAPFSVREGINIFLSGFVPTENLRFRVTELNFKVSENVHHVDDRTIEKRHDASTYPQMVKVRGDFKLTVNAGGFSDSEIIVMLGQNGTGQAKVKVKKQINRRACIHCVFTMCVFICLYIYIYIGKTTFIKMLAGLLKPDHGCDMPLLNVSYKPQTIAPKFNGTVRQLLHLKIPGSYTHPMFVSDVMKPMKIEEIIDQTVKNLSGGELQRTDNTETHMHDVGNEQRADVVVLYLYLVLVFVVFCPGVAIVLTLGKPADIYLIDEPSAYLDSEQRIVTAKVIKRFILHAKKTAFIVEHDFIMATYLADRVIVYSGTPAIDCTCSAPQSLLSGMNAFLKDLEVTFRRDPTNHRPRINKLNSVKDKEQKAAGTFFYHCDTGNNNNNDDDDDQPMSRVDKKKKAKAAASEAKNLANETKKMQDVERAEAAKLAAEDAAD